MVVIFDRRRAELVVVRVSPLQKHERAGGFEERQRSICAARVGQRLAGGLQSIVADVGKDLSDATFGRLRRQRLQLVELDISQCAAAAFLLLGKCAARYR